MLEEQRNYALPTREGLAQIRQTYEPTALVPNAPTTLSPDDYMMKVVVEKVHECFKKKERYAQISSLSLFYDSSVSFVLSKLQKERVRALVKEMNDSGCYIAKCDADASCLTFCIVDMNDVPLVKPHALFCSEKQEWIIGGLALLLLAGPCFLIWLLLQGHSIHILFMFIFTSVTLGCCFAFWRDLGGFGRRQVCSVPFPSCAALVRKASRFR